MQCFNTIDCTYIISEIHALWDFREVVCDIVWSLWRLLAAYSLVLFLVLLVKMLHEAWSVLFRVLLHHSRVHP